MNKRINSYLLAIEKGHIDKYHDRMLVCKGKMKRSEFIKKWGDMKI